MQKTLIIIPCYNEEKRLNQQSYLESAKKLPNIHFIFVDDGNTDHTLAKIKHLHEVNPQQMIFLRLEKNSGKGEAVRQGFLEGIKMNFPYIGYWDADLATPLHEIPKFGALLDDSDRTIVIGSRVRLLGRKIERRIPRHYFGRLFATLASIILLIPVYDTQCGAKLFKKTDDLMLALNKPFKVNWTFDVELLARLILIQKLRGENHLEKHWVEYPLNEWLDVKGSKISFKDFISGGLELIKIGLFLHGPGFKQYYLKYLMRP